MSCRSSPPALELLDEYWFFSNTLATNKKKKKKPPHLPRSPSTSSATGTGTGEKASGSASRLAARRLLLQTPSLPTSRVGMTMESPLPMAMRNNDDLVHEDGAGAGAAASASASGNQQPQAAAVADEVDDDDLNWSSIYEGVLRTRMAEGSGRSSALRRAPSMPVHGDGDWGRETKWSRPSMPRLLRHSHSTLGRHTPTPPTATLNLKQKQVQVQQQQQSKKQTSGFQQLQKWKSSSDLESIEVQGFRDLGFVFDKEELRDSLADVLPGLKQQQQTNSPSPCPRRRPALVRVQSAAEMKDQLRMWAQAVACNVRQEC